LIEINTVNSRQGLKISLLKLLPKFLLIRKRRIVFKITLLFHPSTIVLLFAGKLKNKLLISVNKIYANDFSGEKIDQDEEFGIQR
jgi:hypothetical protein